MDLSHIDKDGAARMVDVGAKATTRRVARAEAVVDLGAAVLDLLLEGGLPKGDAMAVARIAGIQAAKRTSDMIPLCHALPLDYARVDFAPDEAKGTVRVVCEVATSAKTGVEMEALCGAGTAALTLYDMCKAVRRDIRVDGLRLLFKDGGRSGRYEANGEGSAAADGVAS